MSLDFALATNNTNAPEHHAKPGVSLGLLLPDGVGLRNFVFGSFLKPEHGKRTIHALYGVPPEAMEVSRDELPANVELHPLLQFQERPLTYVLRQCLNYAQMFWVDTFPMRLLRSSQARRILEVKNCCTSLSRGWLFAANPRGILFLDNLHSWAFKRRSEVGRIIVNCSNAFGPM